MKIKLPIIIALILCFASCKPTETPESVADKALQKLHSEWLDNGRHSLAHFSMELVTKAQAEVFIKGKEIPNRSVLIDSLFQIDKTFFTWELDSIIERTTPLYELCDFTLDNGSKYEGLMQKAYLDIYKKEGGEFDGKKLCKITETAAAVLAHRDVPMYLIRYKMDKIHTEFIGNEYCTATVGVIKHPEDGYKVVSFMWDK
ncbi:hypothetical protein [uncultured Alistipes sp.]|uniref:hypothetical protein n=2 Tax=uncultured Alistipes sp. TaxID=538949 RepID=UPI00261F4180|nr:hypothetical protein [uncultured Alistipes sp.]